MNRLILSATRAAIVPTPSLRSAATNSTALRPTSSFFTTSQSYTSSSRRSFSDSPSSDTSADDDDDDDELKTGTVKFFNNRDGYGFIIPSWITNKNTMSDDDQMFIHRNDIIQREMEGGEGKYFPILGKGQKVQFKVGVPNDGKNMKKGELYIIVNTNEVGFDV